MSCWARVIRARVTNCNGVIPVDSLNTRAKWNGLSSATSARASAGISSER